MMNKKGMYMSVSVLVILFALFVIFQNRAAVEMGERELVTERARMIVMDDFMGDFRDYYVYVIMAAAAKPALEEMIEARSPAVLPPGQIPLVMSGEDLPGYEPIPTFYNTNSTLHMALASLSFKPDSYELSYHIVDIRQNEYDWFEIEFSVDYIFTFSENIWEAKNQRIVVPISVYSLWHPTYSKDYGPIADDWVEDTSAKKCYIDEVFPDSVHCFGKPNIMPPGLPAPEAG